MALSTLKLELPRALERLGSSAEALDDTPFDTPFHRRPAPEAGDDLSVVDGNVCMDDLEDEGDEPEGGEPTKAENPSRRLAGLSLSQRCEPYTPWEASPSGASAATTAATTPCETSLEEVEASPPRTLTRLVGTCCEGAALGLVCCPSCLVGEADELHDEISQVEEGGAAPSFLFPVACLKPHAGGEGELAPRSLEERIVSSRRLRKDAFHAAEANRNATLASLVVGCLVRQ
mmetsp:Transcript_48264/g.124553  ORF Transcript_48264/g.124553 Transcript_48264/m.124553 type:complete len:232 (-) Transcript_48264:78-773(-)